MPRKLKLWYIPPQTQGIMLYADRAETAASKARKILAATATLATEIQIADHVKGHGVIHGTPPEKDKNQGELVP